MNRLSSILTLSLAGSLAPRFECMTPAGHPAGFAI